VLPRSGQAKYLTPLAALGKRTKFPRMHPDRARRSLTAATPPKTKAICRSNKAAM